MATINTTLKGIDWKNIASQVPVSRKSTGMVDVIRSAAKEIMADGQAYEVRKLQGMIEIAMNQNVTNDEDKVAVNWVTVKYAITHADGFKETDVKNTFVYDASVKKPAKKQRK